ncbi:fad dependent oxidoreductase protein [Lasallia pustulata]|uniref:Fad dependent oxidoreductase protein n=1 Tax=Lasallia pustulata TaxID=136370 RepID=A0A1W5CX64_9LECA|nr:fad dependent oxidoreductase protein [Lasallia pustulata]
MTNLLDNALLFWRDLTPFPAPLHEPTSSSPKILIVGAGVTGLTTAWVLLDKGYHVTIVAKEWASYGKQQRLTSQIAGALWEFPPAVCGQHTDAISLQHSKRWCITAYHIWDAIAASKDLAELSGIRMKDACFFFPGPVEEDPGQMAKMLEIMSSGIRGFRRDANIIKDEGIDPSYGAVDAYQHLAPIIDTDQSMRWLTRLVEQKGANLITRTIHGDLFSQESALRAEYNVDVIINATGLAGTELAGDSSCYPIRGAIIRVINDGTDFPKVNHALTVSADAAHDFVFIVPRNDDILVMGGIAQPHEAELSLTLESPVIKRMRARCEAFLPGLKHARLDSEYPLAQGLRPFRQRNVRVERELRLRRAVEVGATVTVPSRIVHTYGQGGAGWSLAFGCAADVAALVKEALLDLPAKAMSVETVAAPKPVPINVPTAALSRNRKDFLIQSRL